jgi:type IV pilus assembly protein PilX
MKDRNLAFQAAEAALREGEANVVSFAYNCTNARYKPFDKDCNTTLESVPVWENIDWITTTNPKFKTYTGNLGVLSANPRYIIEYLGVADCEGSALGTNDCHNYRITARATGGSDVAVVMLQSIILTGTAPP